MNNLFRSFARMCFRLKQFWSPADKIYTGISLGKNRMMKSGYLPKRIRKYTLGCDGKGAIGCLLSLLLLGAGIFVAVKLVPEYYTYSNFESSLKNEVSRAGAHAYDDETIVTNVLELAKRNEIRLTRDNIRVERFAGQVFIYVHYTVPVDLTVYTLRLHFTPSAENRSL